MATHDKLSEVQVGSHGRLVIPAVLRKALNINAGDRLVARRVGDSLVLERRQSVAQRLQDRFRHIPGDISLADELIAERRGEAVQESET